MPFRLVAEGKENECGIFDSGGLLRLERIPKHRRRSFEVPPSHHPKKIPNRARIYEKSINEMTNMTLALMLTNDVYQKNIQ